MKKSAKYLERRGEGRGHGKIDPGGYCDMNNNYILNKKVYKS